VHAPLAGHVSYDFANRLHLCARELERQRLAELRRQRALVLELDAGADFARQSLRALMQQVDEEQLLEGEP
jgi:hypothetical protein